ncbi:MAG TPA: glutaminase A [Bacillales bacterium]|nr:glutaminase A [Bacillales bacterium]
MKALDEAYLEDAIEECRLFAANGEVLSNLPGLNQTNQNHLGATIIKLDGETVSAGDCHDTITLQSCSKIISLLLALNDYGKERVFQTVGMEPMQDFFNSISHLEMYEDQKPMNPMINAGAIAVASLIKGKSVEDRLERIIELLKKITDKEEIVMNKEVYEAEKQSGSRNRALAYFMKSTGTLVTNVEEALDLYFRFNAIEVDCYDLAKIALFFARGGVLPNSDEKIISARHLRTIEAIMMTSGMYNESGRFAVEAGFPCKSGVSGGIVGVVPNRMGIGVIGPAIDKKGNSTAGGALIRKLSLDFKLNLFEIDHLS